MGETKAAAHICSKQEGYKGRREQHPALVISVLGQWCHTRQQQRLALKSLQICKKQLEVR